MKEWSDRNLDDTIKTLQIPDAFPFYPESLGFGFSFSSINDEIKKKKFPDFLFLTFFPFSLPYLFYFNKLIREILASFPPPYVSRGTLLSQALRG